MAKKGSNTTNPFTPSPGPTQKLGDFLKTSGSSAKPPAAASKSTGPLPQNLKGGKTR